MVDEPLVRTVRLRKVYGDFWGRPRVVALEGLDLAVQTGEVFGLLGPNGSGKTTTIKLLLGLSRPTAGDAFLFGRDPQSQAVKRRVGFLSEETHLYRFLNAEETLAFFARIFGLPKAVARQRASALLERVGLAGARTRRVGEYSKGMARRLGLAQALINDPDLVILDEPTSGLDPIGIVEVKDLILDLKRQGKTVLLSSHLLGEVEDVCDRVVILDRGHLAECGRVDALLTDTSRTTVTLREPSPEMLAAVRQAAGTAWESEAHPRERLESRFRRIVEKARGR